MDEKVSWPIPLTDSSLSFALSCWVFIELFLSRLLDFFVPDPALSVPITHTQHNSNLDFSQNFETASLESSAIMSPSRNRNRDLRYGPWLLDFEIERHICNDRESFPNLDRNENCGTIYLPVLISPLAGLEEGEEPVDDREVVGDQELEIVLKRTYYDEHASDSVISMKQLMRDYGWGYIFRSRNTEERVCLVYEQCEDGNGAVCLEAWREVIDQFDEDRRALPPIVLFHVRVSET